MIFPFVSGTWCALARTGSVAAVALLVAATPLAAEGIEPLTTWLDAMTRAVTAPSDSEIPESQLRASLGKLPTGEAAALLQLALGRALAAASRHSEAAEAFGQAAAALPDPALRAAAELRRAKALEVEGGPRTRASATPRPADPPLARTEALLATAHPREALELLSAKPEGGSAPEGARAAALRALALLPLGRPEEAAGWARRSLEAAADAGTVAAARLALARAAARTGRHDEAMALYGLLARAREPVPGLPPGQQATLAEEASFLARWLLYDAGRYAEASSALARWAREHPRSRRADDARWFSAWALVRAGDARGARRALARLAGGPHAAAAQYWLGRLAPERAEQRRRYREAVRASGREGWYGQLGAARLLSLGAAVAPWRVPRGDAPGDGPGPGEAGATVARAALLLGAGLADEARAELASLATARRARPVASRIAQLAEAAGDLELPAAVARDHLPVTRRSLRWSHPGPWPARLPLVGAVADCDPFLFLAVARRESGFRRGARSAAGARGLLQLMPSTGERLASLAGVPPRLAAVLEVPDVSTGLGALYLGLLADRFGHPAAVLAAYNAGPTAAAPWAVALAGRPLDEWVENLGYRETRRYVKAVLADAQVYRWLRGDGSLLVDGLEPVPAPREGIGF